jgi:hypothetical protein
MPRAAGTFDLIHALLDLIAVSFAVGRHLAQAANSDAGIIPGKSLAIAAFLVPKAPMGFGPQEFAAWRWWVALEVDLQVLPMKSTYSAGLPAAVHLTERAF